MAVQSIAVPPDPGRDARAAQMVDCVGTWPRHTLKVAWGSFEAGTIFRRAPGSKGARYLVNAVACECPDYQRAEQICKHIRAIILFERRQQQPALTPPKRPSYEDLFPACPCGDIADARDGLCDRCASDREFELRRQGAEIARQQIAAGMTFADALNPLAE